jgi:hypothetical protein
MQYLHRISGQSRSQCGAALVAAKTDRLPGRTGWGQVPLIFDKNQWLSGHEGLFGIAPPTPSQQAHDFRFGDATFGQRGRFPAPKVKKSSSEHHRTGVTNWLCGAWCCGVNDLPYEFMQCAKMNATNR